MNILTITNGSYNLTKYNGETFVGESVNLLLITAGDTTITIFDRVYKRLVAIVNCLVSDITLNGKSYTTAGAFEVDFKKAVESGGGGGGSLNIEKLTFTKGESVIKDSTGKSLTYSELKEIVDKTDSIVYLEFTDIVGGRTCTAILWPGYSGESIGFVGADIAYFGKINKILINNQGSISYSSFNGEDISNKVVSLSSSSSDYEYPSAKCVYNLIGDVETILNTING